MKKNNGTLLFVYNADATLFATMTDYVHKVISPKTYACNLCKLTYGNVGMKEAWKEFLDTLPYEKKFQHRDEFLRLHPKLVQVPLPAIFFFSNGRVYTVLDGKEIDNATSLAELQKMITKSLTYIMKINN